MKLMTHLVLLWTMLSLSSCDVPDPELEAAIDADPDAEVELRDADAILCVVNHYDALVSSECGPQTVRCFQKKCPISIPDGGGWVEVESGCAAPEECPEFPLAD